MEQQSKTTRIIASGILTLLFAVTKIQAAPISNNELPLPLLFQSSPAKLGRELSSQMKERVAPTLSLNQAIVLNERSEGLLSDSCKLHAVHASGTNLNGFYSQPLSSAKKLVLDEKSSFEMSLVSFQREMLKIQLTNVSGQGPKLFLECTHPTLLSWTVSDLETNSNNLVRVRVPTFLANRHLKVSPSERVIMNLAQMNGNLFNGIFGSGLPGTMGIQLLLGANLKAYAEETNAPLMVGKKCKLISQANQAMGDEYLKGAKFAFREYRVKAKEGKVELIFDNWNHSPHQIRVECKGSEASVKQMSVAQVERDLNGTIEFYKK